MAGTPRTHEVVADTSPLIHLHRIDRLDLLPSLYGRVLVPPAVRDEIEIGVCSGFPAPSIRSLEWIGIEAPGIESLAGVQARLGRGEREVLALALGRKDILALLDDRTARRFAESHGIQVTGTLGILLRAKRQGYVAAIGPLIDDLENHGFRLHPRTRVSVLEIAGEA